MKINQFFTDVLGVERKPARWSWGATDPKTNRVFLRVWTHDIEPDHEGERVLVGWDKPRRKSNGFPERARHLHQIRNGAVAFGIVCKAVDEETDDVRKIESFDTTTLLKLGALTNENGRTYARIDARAPVEEVVGQNRDQLTVYFFNNCKARDHEAIFGSGAFFDLGTTGKQGAQAANLRPGQVCVVATLLSGNRVAFRWYLFVRVAVLTDENGNPDRVFFGQVVASEIYTKQKAARSVRYKALFKQNGDFKNGSVFRGPVPLDDRPIGTEGSNSFNSEASNHKQGGAGFGDAIENKLVEAAAIHAVEMAYENDGWDVRSVE
ncbi:MAG: hypothetical protein IAG10_01735, partial [Planctomycetaceae bacterium]|nr:hypothetical protein [Planctomycetaceae bacterium]